VITELDVIAGIRVGVLPSPTRFFNADFFALRISGTGAAWRSNVSEFCWRDPAIWLNDTMCQRWTGAPVILLHPAAQILDSESFAQRVAGSIVCAFVRDADAELWAIARILDADAAALLASGDADTSPCVVFPPDAPRTFTLAGGESMLVESDPTLCDHLAVCQRGVWSKGLEKSGVETTEKENEQ
jgi:hypothetical protein